MRKDSSSKGRLWGRIWPAPFWRKACSPPPVCSHGLVGLPLRLSMHPETEHAPYWLGLPLRLSMHPETEHAPLRLSMHHTGLAFL